MLASQVPANFPIPFANAAGVGYKNTIPQASQIGVLAGAASLTDGFPPLNFLPTPPYGSGVPPFGQDFNGILYEITASVQWAQAGGMPVYNSAFSTAIGGYPNGSVLLMASGNGMWMSTVDNNLTDPDTSGAGWKILSIAPGAYLDLSVAGAVNVTLTALQAANAVIDMTGAITADIAVIVPTVTGEWTFSNTTTGAGAITVRTAAGTGITVPQGAAMMLYCDGTNVQASVTAGLTQAQFDNSTKLATTAFVQRQGMQASMVAAYNVNTTMTAANAGGGIYAYGTSALIFTLPLLSTVPIGARIEMWNAANAVLTIQHQGTDAINIGHTIITSFPVTTNDNIIFESNGGSWFIVGGSAMLSYSGLFGSSIATNGYQQLPSGLIIQWGQVASVADGAFSVVYPFAFHNTSVYANFILSANNATGNGNNTLTAISATGFSGANYNGATAKLYWFAIGY